MRVALTGAKSPTNAGVEQSGARSLSCLLRFASAPQPLSRP